MNHNLIRFTLMAALAVPVLALPVFAQSNDDYDAFGIPDDGTPLEQLVPESSELPAALPYFEGDEPDGGPPVAPVASVAQTAAVAPAAGPIAGFAAPQDWQGHSLQGVGFFVPPEWPVVKERSSNLMVFGGDIKTRTGPMFGLSFDRKGVPDPDGAEVIAQGEATMPNGETYQRVEMKAEIDGGAISIHTVIYVSPDKNADGDYTVITLAVYNTPFEAHKETFAQIVGTMTFPAAVARQRSVALGGMVSFDLPDGWQTSMASDGAQMSLRSQYYSGYVEIATDHWVRDAQGLDDVVPARATTAQAAQIFGQNAMLQSWQTSTPEFFIGASMVIGRYDYYRLEQCLPDGAPIGVVIAGAERFLDGEEFGAALASIELALPAGMVTCPAMNAGGVFPLPVPVPMPAAPVPAQPQAAIIAPPVAPVPAQGQGTTARAEGIATEVEGVQFMRPEGWTTLSDRSGDKMFSSPDGRLTILAFWWFPDEPLTGYDSDISVKHVMIDHQSVTQITSEIGALRTIQNVTERARDDEKRFIFTIEGNGVTFEELRLWNDRLVANLRLAPAFDPQARAGAQNTAVPAVPQVVQQNTTRPAAPVIATPSEGFASSDINGWQAYENPRFGTRVSYPAHLFRPMAAAGNDDGRHFEGINGRHTFYVFGQYNVEDLGIEALMERDKQWGNYDRVTYESSGPDWFVLSGFSGENIFYRKLRLDRREEVMHVFEITYPSAQKSVFNSIVREMAKSFGHAGDGVETNQTAPSAAVQSASGAYMGCFADSPDAQTDGLRNRILGGTMIANDRGMTNQKCIAYCGEQGFDYAGTQYTYWCFCGNSYDGRGASANCTMTCAGDSNQICGGGWANSVYRTRN